MWASCLNSVKVHELYSSAVFCLFCYFWACCCPKDYYPQEKFNLNHQLHSSWSVAEFLKSHFGAVPANPGCSAGRQAVGQSTEGLQMAFIDAKPWAEGEDQCTTPILTRFLLF